MNAGSISNRYGKAFLKYVIQEGVQTQALRQSEALLKIILSLPSLREVLMHRPDIQISDRLALAATATGGNLLPQMNRFLLLLERKSRMDLLDRILWSFILQCRQYCNVKSGTLVTSLPDEKLETRVREWLQGMSGGEICLDTKIDQSIIGGFVLEFDGKRLDASVRRQLNILQKELVDKNNRIV